jgi:hypothetical protein
MKTLFERYPLPDMDVFDEVAPSPDFELEIENRIRHMSSQIESSIRSGDTMPKRLACIENNLAPAVNYVTHRAVLGLLGERGLIDRYYEDDMALLSTPSGWEIQLERPVSGSRFMSSLDS